MSLLDDAIQGGLHPGSVVYISTDPQANAEVFLFHFTQPRKTYYFSTEREPAYITEDMINLEFDTKNINFINAFSKYYKVGKDLLDMKGELLDHHILNYAESELKNIIEKDITIIFDSFTFFLLLNIKRSNIKEFINLIYDISKQKRAITYLYSLKETIDKKIENEILDDCDVVFDIRTARAADRITNELAITKARNMEISTDILKFFVRGKVVIDSSKIVA